MTLAAVRHLRAHESALARWDSRWKLIAFLFAMLAVTLTQSWLAAWAAVLLALLGSVVGRVPFSWLGRRLVAVGLALLPFALILPWTNDDGIRLAASLTGRAFAIAILAFTLVATTGLPELCAAAQRLRVPGTLTHLTLLSYRYVFLITDELRRMDVALRVRGFRNRLNRHSFRTIAQVCGSLLVRSHDRAERVAHAMRARGFDGQFYSLTQYRTRLRDVLFFAILSGVTILLWVSDRWLSE